MRISDWSSDVCSSDLNPAPSPTRRWQRAPDRAILPLRPPWTGPWPVPLECAPFRLPAHRAAAVPFLAPRGQPVRLYGPAHARALAPGEPAPPVARLRRAAAVRRRARTSVVQGKSVYVRLVLGGR